MLFLKRFGFFFFFFFFLCWDAFSKMRCYPVDLFCKLGFASQWSCCPIILGVIIKMILSYKVSCWTLLDYAIGWHLCGSKGINYIVDALLLRLTDQKFLVGYGSFLFCRRSSRVWRSLCQAKKNYVMSDSSRPFFSRQFESCKSCDSTWSTGPEIWLLLREVWI